LGQVAHLCPEATVNRDILTKGGLFQQLRSKISPKSTSAVCAGGKQSRFWTREQNTRTEKLTQGVLNSLRELGIEPSVFIRTDTGGLDVLYTSKPLFTTRNYPIKPSKGIFSYFKKRALVCNTSNDFVFIRSTDNRLKHLKKADLIDFLNVFFGEWHVSKNDKLVWVNEHLDINNPKFIEEIPRKYYNTSA